MSNTANPSAVFFLGTKAHYQVLDPETFDSGNTSTETLYQNEEFLKEDSDSSNCNRIWNFDSDMNVNFETDTGVKKRFNRRTNEVISDMQPATLNGGEYRDIEKEKPRRKFFSFLTSLTRRKRRDIQYLQNLENVLTTCTFRESCRCLDCQSRYFEYESDLEDLTDDYAYSYTVQDVEDQTMADEVSDDEVFISYNPGDNTSTDLLIEDTETITTVSSGSDEPEEKQTQLEVAASTSAMLNVLLFHPACIVQ